MKQKLVDPCDYKSQWCSPKRPPTRFQQTHVPPKLPIYCSRGGWSALCTKEAPFGLMEFMRSGLPLTGVCNAAMVRKVGAGGGVVTMGSFRAPAGGHEHPALDKSGSSCHAVRRGVDKAAKKTEEWDESIATDDAPFPLESHERCCHLLEGLRRPSRHLGLSPLALNLSKRIFRMNEKMKRPPSFLPWGCCGCVALSESLWQ